MNKVKWIQISDLHFGSNSPYSKKSKEALTNYLSNRCKEIDYIFITGDIIFAKGLNPPAKKKAYVEAEKYLKQLYALIAPNDSNYNNLWKKVFVVPGNHDLTRDSARESCIKGLMEEYSKDKLGEIDTSYITNTKTAMANYNTFYNSLIGKRNKSKLGKNIHYVIETDKINILHINTCLASCCDKDDGNLILGFNALSEAIEKINSDKPTIVLAHHNFDCLEKTEQRKLEILLKEKDIFLYLCGHSHERESNIILRYNQMKMVNTFTCGTLLFSEGKNDKFDTVFFVGELDLESKEGTIKSYKWTLDDGWQEDIDFGHVQSNKSNFRTFMKKTALNGSNFPINLNFDLKSNGVIAKIVSNQSSERNIAFYEMNDRAKKSLSIYGIGITSVSKNKELFDRILSKGGIIRLCMADPNVFKLKNCLAISDKICNIEKSNFCIYSKHIDRYIRDEYFEDIQKSFGRIKDYKENLKENSSNFQVKLLNSFIPMSINMINEDTTNAEVIIEYNMPFTSKRLLISLNKKNYEDYFKQIKNYFEIIWEKAEEVKYNENR